MEPHVNTHKHVQIIMILPPYLNNLFSIIYRARRLKHDALLTNQARSFFFLFYVHARNSRNFQGSREQLLDDDFFPKKNWFFFFFWIFKEESVACTFVFEIYSYASISISSNRELVLSRLARAEKHQDLKIDDDHIFISFAIIADIER